MTRICSAVAFVVSISAFASGEDAKLNLELVESGVHVREGDRDVLFYQRTRVEKDGLHRSHYVHPLYDLDGNVVTEDFPDDHRHHHGIFWGWHQTLAGGVSIGDGWTGRDYEWNVRDVVAEVSPTHDSVALNLDVEWTSPKFLDDAGTPLPFVRETTTIRVHPTTNDRQNIDFKIGLLALVPDVKLGGSDNVKGYGGFSVRMKLPEDTKFEGTGGAAEPIRTAIDAGPWMNITGTIGGKGPTGLAILEHPSNPGFPQPWILRRQRSMQNPAWPGREPAPLSTETPLVLRYRIVLHKGTAERTEIDGWQKEYATPQ